MRIFVNLATRKVRFGNISSNYRVYALFTLINSTLQNHILALHSIICSYDHRDMTSVINNMLEIGR